MDRQRTAETADGSNGHSWPEPPQKNLSERPVVTFLDGWVETRVWANRSDNPGAWRVQQVRVYPGRDGGLRLARTLAPVDVPHALRGLYRANRWIRREERRRHGWFR
jgi:hypothetical protein